MWDGWHIRGVSEEARKAAKMGAAGQGVTIGRWLEMAIMAHANWAGSPGAVADNPIPKKAKIPVRPGDFDPAPMPVDEEVLIPPGPDIEPRKKRVVKACAHGMAKGNNCWQCGGLAAVE
jgi:hypothetical protein